MSQSYLGWPSNRPRLYTVLVKKDSGALADPGLAAIDKLYRIPNMSVLAHMVADRDFRSVSTLSVRCLIDSEFVCSTLLDLLDWPVSEHSNSTSNYNTLNWSKDEIEAMRKDLAHKFHRSLSSTFQQLLSGRIVILQNLQMTMTVISFSLGHADCVTVQQELNQPGWISTRNQIRFKRSGMRKVPS